MKNIMYVKEASEYLFLDCMFNEFRRFRKLLEYIICVLSYTILGEGGPYLK